jgi:hypothetical protein
VIIDAVVIDSTDAVTSKTFKWVIEWSLHWARFNWSTYPVRKASTCTSTENFISRTLTPTADTLDFKRWWDSQLSRLCSTICTKAMFEDSILLFFSNTANSCDRIVYSWCETEYQGLYV